MAVPPPTDTVTDVAADHAESAVAVTVTVVAGAPSLTVDGLTDSVMPGFSVMVRLVPVTS